MLNYCCNMNRIQVVIRLILFGNFAILPMFFLSFDFQHCLKIFQRSNVSILPIKIYLTADWHQLKHPIHTEPTYFKILLTWFDSRRVPTYQVNVIAVMFCGPSISGICYNGDIIAGISTSLLLDNYSIVIVLLHAIDAVPVFIQLC